MHELSKAAQDLLASSAGESPLKEDQARRIWGRVEQGVQWPASVTSHPRAVATSGVFSASRAQRAPTDWRLRRWAKALWLSLGPWGVLGVTAAAAAIGTAALMLATPTPASAPATENAALNADGPGPVVPRAPGVETPVLPTGETALVPTAETTPTLPSQLPAPERDSRPARQRPLGSHTKPPAPLQEEVASLDLVYRKLDAEQYAEALTELQRHDKSYPQGALALEARAASWIARCKLNPEPATREAATTFMQRLGKTPLAKRVQRACGEVQRAKELP